MVVECIGFVLIYEVGKIFFNLFLIGFLYLSIIVYIKWVVWVIVLLCYLDIYVSVFDFINFVGFIKLGYLRY